MVGNSVVLGDFSGECLITHVVGKQHEEVVSLPVVSNIRNNVLKLEAQQVHIHAFTSEFGRSS
jgi:hypothetical protein